MRILHEEDREQILAYVGKEPEMNLFFIGDIESFGVENETVNIYLHEERDRWDFLILRFHRYFLLYSQYEDYNAGEAIAFFEGQQPDCISGKTVLLDRIAPAFPQWAVQSTYMSRCDRVDGSFSGSGELVIRRLEQRDVVEAIDLLTEIQEFSKTFKREEREEQIRRMEEEMARGSKAAVGGFLNGRMIATASTSAENSESAMIVGVATAEGHRGKGYASAVVGALCRDCFERGKKYLCLFYDNPVAGRIYNRIGFQELGEYGMLR
ncbi:MAG: GNAT family N-acetyltransferase [bacterium]|nr:GNAT family N-acetyltransferase [bacterium]MCM1376435.1 GNAT family N-acetyltransferase [Muribaculum sp.]